MLNFNQKFIIISMKNNSIIGISLILTLLPLFVTCSVVGEAVGGSQLDSIANLLRAGIKQTHSGVTTADTNLSADGLKINFQGTKVPFGIFQKLNLENSYFQLYYCEMRDPQNVTKLQGSVRLSERGSLGFPKYNPYGGGFFVAYQLENHETGNTIALRYYQSQDKLKVNNYLYEYQLAKSVVGANVVNLGGPSIEEIKLIPSKVEPKFNQFYIKIKYHTYPAGEADYPSEGQIHLDPLRDFVNAQGQWVGGSKQQYTDWVGYADHSAKEIIKAAGCHGLIGQRDSFTVEGEKYYLYGCNINPDYDWYSWRIYLVSFKEHKAVNIGLGIQGDFDLMIPRISLRSQTANIYDFVMTFFLPWVGTTGTTAKAGQAIAVSKFWIP